MHYKIPRHLVKYEEVVPGAVTAVMSFDPLNFHSPLTNVCAGYLAEVVKPHGLVLSGSACVVIGSHNFMMNRDMLVPEVCVKQLSEGPCAECFVVPLSLMDQFVTTYGFDGTNEAEGKMIEAPLDPRFGPHSC